MGSAVFANTEIAKTSQLFPSQFKLIADVRFGSKADVRSKKCGVRFTPKSGHFVPEAEVGNLAGSADGKA